MMEALALFATGTFFGAALYISVVQHPAALQAGVETAARFFVPMYGRAAPMQALLAVVGSAAALWMWTTGAGTSWLVGAGLLFASVPFTLLVILPINKALLAPERDPASPDTEALLHRWGRLHAVRSALSGAALLVLLLRAG